MENSQEEEIVLSMCKSCVQHQEQLLEDGDGSQVICEHLPDNYEEEKDEVAVAAAAVPVAVVSTTEPPSSTSVPRKRKFISDYEFVRVGDDKIKRKIAPVQSWKDLTIRKTYRALAIKEMTVTIKKVSQIGYYGEFEDSEEQLVNVWLTDIIRQSLKSHDLSSGNVYIKPLGKAKSMTSGFDYHDFVIVVDNKN